jgi:alpha-1,6-mannosyltransferase
MTLTPIRLGWLLVSAALFALLGYSIERTQFSGLLGFYFLVFWGYWIRVRAICDLDPNPDRFYLLAAVLFRVLLLFAPTNLSDDYARFIWDGRLLIHGYNPYLYLPRSLPGTDIAQLANLTPDLFRRLNSPDYYTVYPPLNQAFFALAAWLGGDSLQAGVVWLRVPILLAEIGTIYLLPRVLRRLGMNPNFALIYALNPLVILELTGNVHFEGIVIFCCVWALSLRWGGVFPLALAVSTKLLPLITLPLLIRRLGWRRGIIYSTLVIGTSVLFFLPFLSLELVQNIASSVNLYFQKFEFNASVYYLIREAGYWLAGYNIIGQAGPILSLVTLAGICWLALSTNKTDLSTRLLLTLTLYFAMATTVHPWYITLVVAASVFAPFRYPLVWSALVWVSYATYRQEPYAENLWLTAMEYAVVLVVGLMEWWNLKKE